MISKELLDKLDFVEKIAPVRDPKVDLVLDLRAQIQQPWFFEMSKSQADDLAARIRKAFDDRKKDWQDILHNAVISKMAYAPISDQNTALDRLNFSDNVELVARVFMRRYGIDPSKAPKQTAVVEEERPCRVSIEFPNEAVFKEWWTNTDHKLFEDVKARLHLGPRERVIVDEIEPKTKAQGKRGKK